MYRIFDSKVIFLAIAWLSLGFVFLYDLVDGLLEAVDATGVHLRWTAIPMVAWVFVNLLAAKPVWRFLWRRFPVLEKWIYPDLNGAWDVKLESNWSRQEQLFLAAKGETPSFDIKHCDPAELEDLLVVNLKAEIEQSWWKIELKLWNPQGDTPIKSSETIDARPIRAKGFAPAQLCYFFDQQNDTDNIADDVRFAGAACLKYDSSSRSLEGSFWTSRVWPRALNTAGKLHFSRSV
ncbi:hypothetical protein GRI72_09335 [Altererythrobacter marinus]|uniref:SMODS-associating 2TM beta-strand rich effector domain-containing protein n=2 Tax=Pelagerythrobacter marinus TaxID=538382 RepID=A0ABW9UVZ4_9SPHN|nr:hypothetical protein [Pelagerythrobacter marinus]